MRAALIATLQAAINAMESEASTACNEGIQDNPAWIEMQECLEALMDIPAPE